MNPDEWSKTLSELEESPLRDLIPEEKERAPAKVRLASNCNTMAIDAVCPVCGKKYTRTTSHVYKIDVADGSDPNVCSYHCMRVVQNEQEAKDAEKRRRTLENEIRKRAKEEHNYIDMSSAEQRQKLNRTMERGLRLVSTKLEEAKAVFGRRAAKDREKYVGKRAIINGVESVDEAVEMYDTGQLSASAVEWVRQRECGDDKAIMLTPDIFADELIGTMIEYCRKLAGELEAEGAELNWRAELERQRARRRRKNDAGK